MSGEEDNKVRALESKKEYLDTVQKNMTSACLELCFDTSTRGADKLCLDTCYNKYMGTLSTTYNSIRNILLDNHSIQGWTLLRDYSMFTDIIYSNEHLVYNSYEYNHLIERDRMTPKER